MISSAKGHPSSCTTAIGGTGDKVQARLIIQAMPSTRTKIDSLKTILIAPSLKLVSHKTVLLVPPGRNHLMHIAGDAGLRLICSRVLTLGTALMFLPRTDKRSTTSVSAIHLQPHWEECPELVLRRWFKIYTMAHEPASMISTWLQDRGLLDYHQLVHQTPPLRSKPNQGDDLLF